MLGSTQKNIETNLEPQTMEEKGFSSKSFDSTNMGIMDNFFNTPFQGEEVCEDKSVSYVGYVKSRMEGSHNMDRHEVSIISKKGESHPKYIHSIEIIIIDFSKITKSNNVINIIDLYIELDVLRRQNIEKDVRDKFLEK